jgi:hypothetical protein
MPVIARTAIVVAARGDGSIGKLYDKRGAIGMVRIPWAGIEDPLVVSSMPRTMRDYGQVMLGNPAWKIE